MFLAFVCCSQANTLHRLIQFARRWCTFARGKSKASIKDCELVFNYHFFFTATLATRCVNKTMQADGIRVSTFLVYGSASKCLQWRECSVITCEHSRFPMTIANRKFIYARSVHILWIWVQLRNGSEMNFIRSWSRLILLSTRISHAQRQLKYFTFDRRRWQIDSIFGKSIIAVVVVVFWLLYLCRLFARRRLLKCFWWLTPWARAWPLCYILSPYRWVSVHPSSCACKQSPHKTYLNFYLFGFWLNKHIHPRHRKMQTCVPSSGLCSEHVHIWLCQLS